MTLNVFQAGKGINAIKLNDNFSQLQQTSNTNENSINTLYNTSLKLDGTNITQNIVQKFQQETPIILSNKSGNVNLTDNRTHFLSLSGNVNVILPNVPSDQYSHTVVLIVQGSSYSVTSKTVSGETIAKHLYNGLYVNPRQTYSLMYIYNKIDNSWYFNLTQ